MAERHGMNGSWMRIHGALNNLAAGSMDAAEEQLRGAAEESWQVNANLGRILETRRSPRAALDCYEKASETVTDAVQAARIQIRIASCLRTLGRADESRRVLEYALDLNPDDLNARLELSRLNQAGF
jgi:tetratricopeptide (TPR) repeat protein